MGTSSTEWHAVQHPADPDRWFVQTTAGGFGHDICEMSNGSREQHAKMIAANPDLIAAAVAFQVAFDAIFARGLPLSQGGETIDHTALNEAARLLSAALRKAGVA